MVHICVKKITVIGSDNGFSPDQRQAIIWTNAGILLIGALGTNFGEILIKTNAFSFIKMHLQMLPVKWRQFSQKSHKWNASRLISSCSCLLLNNSHIKCQNTLSSLTQFTCRGLRLWNTQGHEVSRYISIYTGWRLWNNRDSIAIMYVLL